MSSNPKPLIVGISGCSSSGKTTLARHLRDIFPNTHILHQDDFYKEEKDLPMKDGLLDWDCAGAIDVEGMASSLRYIRENATFPSNLESKEDQNSIGESPIPSTLVQTLKSHVSSALPSSTSPPSVADPHSSAAATQAPSHHPEIFLLDGFLLYPPSMSPIHPYIDLKLFLRTSYAKAKGRREARTGYVTIEGFWTDPPGYVDKIVWPNYVEEHGYMFENGDVDGVFDRRVLDREGIRVEDAGSEVGESDMGKTLEWSVQALLEELKKRGRSQ